MTKNKDIVIIGAGGHAMKMTDIALQNNLNLLGYISTEKPGTKINNHKVLGYLDYYKEKINTVNYHIAIGMNAVRYDIEQKIETPENAYRLISKSAIISSNVKIAEGTSIGHLAIIQTGTSIGKNCLIDSAAIIEHNSLIHDHVNIAPGSVICGSVTINSGSIIGAGATVIEKIKIGKNTLIGAGSVVIRDIPDNVVAYGNPAKIIRKRTFYEQFLK